MIVLRLEDCERAESRHSRHVECHVPGTDREPGKWTGDWLEMIFHV